MEALNSIATLCTTSESFYRGASSEVAHPKLRDWMNRQANLHRAVAEDIRSKAANALAATEKKLSKRAIRKNTFKNNVEVKDVEALSTSLSIAKFAMKNDSVDACMPHLAHAEKLILEAIAETADSVEEHELQDLLRLRAMRIDNACRDLKVL